MSTINCSVSNCSYNNNGRCHSSTVNIGGIGARIDSDTCCASFLNETVYSNFSNSETINMTDGETSLMCSASTCKHNTAGACKLKNINIGAGTNVKFYSETECLNFENR